MDHTELLMARGWVTCLWPHSSEVDELSVTCGRCIDGLIPSYDALIPVAFELAAFLGDAATYEESGLPSEEIRTEAFRLILRLERAERLDRETTDEQYASRS